MLYFTANKVERLGGRSDAPVIQGTAQYHRLLLIIIESGGMYCLTVLLFLCFVVTGSPAKHITFSILGQLTVRQCFVHRRG